tara:strand:+ start:485 stop:1153 length:669 start_codon:yes stop_codon:yes gene_type:complete
MDLLEVMRTTFACREFQDEEIEDEVIHRILDNARFAPSGGNRQGVHVIVVKDFEKKRKLGQMCGPALLLYAAQQAAGEVPFNTVEHSTISEQEIDTNSGHDFEIFNRMEEVPLLLIVSIDLSEVASMDKNLDRVGIVTGASVYPFVWNILLAARNEGLGGVITTAIVPEEESVREILDLPENHAIAAMIPIGKPVKQLSQLTRRSVEDFTTVDSYKGNVFKK